MNLLLASSSCPRLFPPTVMSSGVTLVGLLEASRLEEHLKNLKQDKTLRPRADELIQAFAELALGKQVPLPSLATHTSCSYCGRKMHNAPSPHPGRGFCGTKSDTQNQRRLKPASALPPSVDPEDFIRLIPIGIQRLDALGSWGLDCRPRAQEY